LSALNGQNDKKSQAGDVRSRASRRSGVSQGRPAYAASIASSQKAPTEVYSEINENEEWVAIQKFNTLLHYEEQKQSLLREAERKRLIREELDRQVLQKLQRKNNEGQEDRVYDEMYEEHGKLLEQREKDKAKANMDKIICDKQSRDLQMRDEKKRKKMEEKENMASEQEYIRRLQQEMDAERSIQMEKRR
jgi:Ran GTPase-activating protein (RanGAP) involved in mRNA processing and transport